MADNPRTTTSAATVLAVAVVLLVPAFAVGVMIGRSTLERRAAGKAAPDPDPGVSKELAACQQELEAPSTAQAAPSAAVVAPREGAKPEVAGAAAEVEELEEAVRECKKRDVLTKAEVCIAAGREFDMIMTSAPEEFRSCRLLFHARELIKSNLKKCVELGDVPEDSNRDQLTEADARIVLDAVKVREGLDEKALVERIDAVMDACSKKHPRNY
ncbi:hypothetical protein [Polyangium aurulentum]|uniref:hypothetical protein n=1 Tax=Polyangium aurulentum TaxID=2567896 RepID=UPI0010ADD945|nr:hypothetical protein [Polyangium aurulentum]UQA55815.1 hypothetical protein E8A73_031355 [Polyangium aurulentum]